MKISLNWIKELINTELEVDVLLENLTDLGLECSSTMAGPTFKNVVVGKILKVEKHNNSDHLSLCQVDIGDQDYLQIVCGAPNVKEDIYVPVALVGASLGNGSFKIKKSKIRGEESFGMICSEKELDLGDSHDGIMILDEKPSLGLPFEDFLKLDNDVLIDFDLTPNRGDCLSFLGIAREIAILDNTSHQDLTNKVIKDNTSDINENETLIDSQISINIEDKQACPIYLGRIINDVKVIDSPKWLKDKLHVLGMKPINVIVDLANYIMLTFGQPMHTFDFDKIQNKKINVGYPSNTKKIMTLDSVDRYLDSKNLLIKDGDIPIAIAGVIGGKNTEVDSDTQNIFIESALFDPIVVRKSAKKIDLSTDASKRYERNIDPALTKIALNILSGLIIKYAGGKASQGIIESSIEFDNQEQIKFYPSECNKFLGTSLEDVDIENVFNRVNISFIKKDDGYLCTPPTYRSHDVKRDVDLYEEIARVIGFNNIDNSSNFSINYNMISRDKFDIIDHLKFTLANNGYYEHYSNSLISDKEKSFFFEQDGVCLSNPLNKNMKYIRNSMLPGMLKAVSFNYNRQVKNYKMFEIGATYKSFLNNSPNETMSLGIVWPTIKFDHWKDNKQYDFFNAKGDVNFLLDKLHISSHEYSDKEQKGFDFCQSIKINRKEIGFIGMVSNQILKNSDIKKENLVYADFNIDLLRESLSKTNKFKDPSVYPSIERDISILVDNKYNAKKIEDCIKNTGGKRLKALYLFDVYADNTFKNNKISYGFKMIFQSNSETLKDSEIDKIMNEILNKLKNNFDITQR
tara:strand:- start:10459 stop:12861 length:2403 start_codon:yes stop_codon:yes gene_type:complete